VTGGPAPRPALVLVATPIGNLGDLSPRAVEELRAADVIAAEDTRRTRALLSAAGVPAAGRLRAVHAHNERAEARRIVEAIRSGRRVAYVSDAGTPGIADPGYHLVRGALAAGVRVVPVPGPSAVTAVVSAAGIPAERFLFEGFLPTRPGPRAQRLRALAAEPRALVFFEAARRLPAFLAAARAALGDREAVIARELTKRHEEWLRGRLSELALRAGAAVPLKGEVTVLIAGAAEAAVSTPADALDARIWVALASGQHLRELAQAIARETGMSRRAVYRRALELARQTPAEGGGAR
jgi:16S rRNA (cytidine1402-2'-O)-methyltransferase